MTDKPASMEDIIQFMQSFREAREEVVARLRAALLSMQTNINPSGRAEDKLGRTHQLTEIACGAVLQNIETQLTRYTSNIVHRDLYDRYGPDGKKALFTLITRDGIDPIATAVASKSYKGPTKDKREAKLRAELLHAELSNVRSGWAINKGDVPIYGAQRSKILELAQLTIRSMQPV